MRAIRERHGWKQTELAVALGVHPQTVSNRERGDPRYPIDREAELALQWLDEHPEVVGGEGWRIGDAK